MQWNDDAIQAVGRAPFFVRGFIRRQCEEHVLKLGRDTVTLTDVEILRNKALSEISDKNDGNSENGGLTTDQIEKLVERTGTQIISNSRFYEIKVCGGGFGCPRTLFDTKELAEKIEKIIETSGVADAITGRVKGPVLVHHKLRVSISGCANSCSQPQISDFGIQGRTEPARGENECTECGECVRICQEKSVEIVNGGPVFDMAKCIDCGDCTAVCPTGTIISSSCGFSILIGGKLGRHPKLAEKLFSLTDEATVLQTTKVICKLFSEEMKEGERFADVVERLETVHIRYMAEHI